VAVFEWAKDKGIMKLFNKILWIKILWILLNFADPGLYAVSAITFRMVAVTFLIASEHQQLR